ncbi:acetyl-CoA hydrolase/transferase family protein [Endozoicomonas sp. 8E]|uniref:acetyl-CoA hydrolase/transferase family protein n=1 Tax=Endozoicomonas sp. 8E TaxID=3035692 RepID=UPI0029392A88|nr:acetyl-CoA hydrolase/transferase C-terminal domain-containing protein [Endozoicomonas sp. 8E]WOG25997.1 acetyl-CoA hydrolase/transferase C-terminal domain-containing protein [Endozoicomonas sp. 8E]
MTAQFDIKNWQSTYDRKWSPLESAANEIQSGDRVWIGGANGVAIPVLKQLCHRKDELKDVELFGALLMFPFDFLKAEFKGHINYNCLFTGPLERKFLGPHGNIKINSVHFSQTQSFMKNIMKPNVLLMEVSRPDENGFMSLGHIGALLGDSVVENAEKVIVVVNDQVPYLKGESNFVHVDQVDKLVECNHELPFAPQAQPSELEQSIASHILPYINDGDTIQIGFGGLSDAVAYGLENKKNLGVHSEMMTDSLLHLIKIGAIDNSNKTIDKNKLVYGLAVGSRELLDFLDNNDDTHVMPLSTLNRPEEIAEQDNFISINGALMCDLTGQIAAEGVGLNQISCTGGQLDFVRGAGMSKGGKSFIALSSVFKGKNGLESRIQLTLPAGTPVTTPRSDAMFIVTEYGVADVHNRPLKDRTAALIAISHPDFREALTAQAREAGLID